MVNALVSLNYVVLCCYVNVQVRVYVVSFTAYLPFVSLVMVWKLLISLLLTECHTDEGF